MNLRTVKPMDIVQCNRLGRKFWARVDAHLGRALKITPLSYNINYYIVSGRDVIAHYPRRARRDGHPQTRSITLGAIVSYDRDGQTLIAQVAAKSRGRLQVTPLQRAGQRPEQITTGQVTGHYARRGRRAGKQSRAQEGGSR